MAHRKRTAILYRNADIPSEYYYTGKKTLLRNVGELPRIIKRLDDDGKVDTTFIISAVTTDFIYYLDIIGDSEYTVMLNRKMQLVSDNYHAYNDLSEIISKNESLLWMSNSVKIWQKEQYIQPHRLTPDFKKALTKVDIEATLTKKQKGIYYAFLNNGPVKYTKAQALMAVLSNVDYLPDLIIDPLKFLGQ